MKISKIGKKIGSLVLTFAAFGMFSASAWGTFQPEEPAEFNNLEMSDIKNFWN